MDYLTWIPTRRCVLALLIVFPFLVNSAWSQTGTFTKIIPQMVIGSFDGGATKYVTVIEIIDCDGPERQDCRFDRRPDTRYHVRDSGTCVRSARTHALE